MAWNCWGHLCAWSKQEGSHAQKANRAQEGERKGNQFSWESANPNSYASAQPLMSWACIRSRCGAGSRRVVFRRCQWGARCESPALRVSGHGQKDDLEIQLQRLQVWAATERKGMETLVLSDIGSGLKASRRQLQRLLKLVCEDKVGEVAITYEDRLTRFGQEYLETLFACFGVMLTVLEPGESQTPEQDLTDDLLA